jgi:hypothetical protein
VPQPLEAASARSGCMKTSWCFAVVLLAVGLSACESDLDKCKKVCDDVVAKEHGADSEAVKNCKQVCEQATK